ncbi:MAG: septal ring lytic transglycosylase RlpA family protein [Bryobacteraceae bacterium]|jgi:rare lipoprotein A
MKRAIPLVAAILLLSPGCGRKKRIPAAAPPPIATEEAGIASWYGHPYHGRASASGEIYDMEELTAAHRTLPFGTLVRVENLANGLSVDVRINDRGPFVEGRIIDLSRAAARRIQMLGPGTAKVRLHIQAQPERNPAGCYAVQIGAFRDRGNADRVRASMQARYGAARLLRREGNPALWRVLVGREPTEEDATALAGRMRSEGNVGFVVRVDGPESN